MPELAEVHHRRISTARFQQEREKAATDRSTTPLRWARLNAEGGRGMTQQALAVLSGCSRDAVVRAEKGDPRTSPATLRRLCAVLGISVSEARP